MNASSEFDFLLKVKRELILNTTQLRELGFIARSMIEANHAADTVAKRFRIDIEFYANYSLAYSG